VALSRRLRTGSVYLRRSTEGFALLTDEPVTSADAAIAVVKHHAATQGISAKEVDVKFDLDTTVSSDASKH
jgi:hypothetical protein